MALSGTKSLAELYAVLELPPTATDEEVKRAYRRQSLLHHPDKNRNSPESEERFKLINVAYKVLSDPHARLAFASYGAEGVARMDEYNAHGAELDETAKKMWMIAGAATAFFLLADYFLHFRLEWLGVLAAALYFVWTRGEGSAAASLGVLAALTLVSYLVLPASYIGLLAQIGLVSVALLVLNTVYIFLDVSLVLWVGLVVLECAGVRGVAPVTADSRVLTQLLAHLVVVVCGMALLLLHAFFSQEIILEKWPSPLFPYVLKLRSSGSFMPLFALLVFVPIWTLDYYTGWPFEHLLLVVIAALNLVAIVAEGALDVRVAGVVAACALGAYLLVPPSLLYLLASLARIVHVLLLLHTTEVAEVLMTGAPRPVPAWTYGAFFALLFAVDWLGRDVPQRWLLLAVVALCTSLAAIYHLLFHAEQAAQMMRASATNAEPESAAKETPSESTAAPVHADAAAPSTDSGAS